jgi:hypothetical protein
MSVTLAASKLDTVAANTREAVGKFSRIQIDPFLLLKDVRNRGPRFVFEVVFTAPRPFDHVHHEGMSWVCTRLAIRSSVTGWQTTR